MGNDISAKRRVSTTRLVLISATLGFAGLIAALATFLLTQGSQDIRPVLVVAFCAFFTGGLFAPHREVPFNWRGACLVILGGIVPAVVVRVAGVAFTDHLIGLALAVTAARATLGSSSRR